MNLSFFTSLFLLVFTLFPGSRADMRKSKATAPVSRTLSLTPEELLTSTVWQPGELRAVQGNSSYYYKRGEYITPDYDLDNESIEFRKDGTGTYVGTDGKSYPITWQFTNEEKTKLVWIHPHESPIEVRWEIRELKPGLIRYDEYYTLRSWNTITFGTRISKNKPLCPEEAKGDLVSRQ